MFLNVLKSVTYFVVFTLTGLISIAQNNITVDATNVIKTLSSNAIGINMDYLMDGTYLSPGTPSATANALKGMGMRILRYPGGEKSDNYLWSSPPYNSSKPQMVLTGDCNFPSNDSRFVEADTKTAKPEVLDFDEFITVCRQAGAEPMVVCAYDAAYFGGSEAAKNDCSLKPTKQQLIESARQWVLYANKTKNYNVKYWCIGNESWNDCTYNGCVTAAQYAADIVEFSNAMRAVDPSIKIIANGRGDAWWRTLLQSAPASNVIDYLGVSCYPINQFTGGYEAYRSSNRDFREEVLVAADAILAYASPVNSTKIKVMATEFNAIDFSEVWRNNNDVGHALVAAEIIGQCLESERVESLIFWNTRWITNVTAPEHVFDAFNRNSNLNANGLLLSVMGSNILSNMVSISDQGFLKTFAFYDKVQGKLNVVIINKDNVSQPVNVSVSGFLTGPSLAKWEFSGANANDLRPTYTLKETTTVNTYPYAVTVSANSVTVLKLSGPAQQGNETEIKLINNPVRGIAYISVSDIRYTPLFVDLYDAKGSLLKRYPQINTNGTLPIDVNGFPTGIYFLRFTTPASQQTIKIFKD